MEFRIYEREKLYREIWAEPMTAVAKRYGVSDSALRKQCLKLGIPVPLAGHWSKVRAGHKVPTPPLPKWDGPKQIVVNATAINSEPSGRRIADALLFLPGGQREEVLEYCSALRVRAGTDDYHPLVKNTIQHRRSKKAATASSLEVITIESDLSDELIGRAYGFLSALFFAVEHLGCSVQTSLRSEEGRRGYGSSAAQHGIFICQGVDTVKVYVKEEMARFAHVLTDEELARKKRDPYFYVSDTELVLTGRLRFCIDERHATRKRWADTDRRKIEEVIGEIVVWVLDAINCVKTAREDSEAEANRRLREEILRMQLEEARRQETARLDVLEQLASRWSRAQQITKFANAVEGAMSGTENESEHQALLQLVRWAREKADWLDPLVGRTDEVLGGNMTVSDFITSKGSR